MTTGQLPSSHRRTPRGPRTALAIALALTALTAMSGCASESKSFAPPRGSITNDRAIGDILVKFTPPDVNVSEDAGKLLAGIEGPVRYVVKRPMSGGVWLVTAITASADVTLNQAVETLRAAPRVESATPDRTLKPHHGMPPSRDMPQS
ncbi:hypothetical protein SAMN05216345_107111 [Cupriavidus sp. YR651]|uniref:hypothetical protein n=1 Tax=Cupriavidus sp. YR651 TaxID=1855315 RepID=UPI0008906904|nr:hypothetical protein [Cupriavidus sp. YR651]SDD24304.1 hypothetical protein SAMN05216345_107111 [Cupriavidus sp. YR651]